MRALAERGMASSGAPASEAPKEPVDEYMSIAQLRFDASRGQKDAAEKLLNLIKKHGERPAAVPTPRRAVSGREARAVPRGAAHLTLPVSHRASQGWRRSTRSSASSCPGSATVRGPDFIRLRRWPAHEPRATPWRRVHHCVWQRPTPHPCQQRSRAPCRVCCARRRSRCVHGGRQRC